MTLHQYITDWFKQFTINVLPEERKTVTKNFMSGYKCEQFGRCPFVHMFASLIANKRNTHLFDEYINMEKLEWENPINIMTDEWIHMIDLAAKWSDKERLKD